MASAAIPALIGVQNANKNRLSIAQRLGISGSDDSKYEVMVTFSYLFLPQLSADCPAPTRIALQWERGKAKHGSVPPVPCTKNASGICQYVWESASVTIMCTMQPEGHHGHTRVRKYKKKIMSLTVHEYRDEQSSMKPIGAATVNLADYVGGQSIVDVPIVLKLKKKANATIRLTVFSSSASSGPPSQHLDDSASSDGHLAAEGIDDLSSECRTPRDLPGGSSSADALSLDTMASRVEELQSTLSEREKDFQQQLQTQKTESESAFVALKEEHSRDLSSRETQLAEAQARIAALTEHGEVMQEQLQQIEVLKSEKQRLEQQTIDMKGELALARGELDIETTKLSKQLEAKNKELERSLEKVASLEKHVSESSRSLFNPTDSSLQQQLLQATQQAQEFRDQCSKDIEIIGTLKEQVRQIQEDHAALKVRYENEKFKLSQMTYANEALYKQLEQIEDSMKAGGSPGGPISPTEATISSNASPDTSAELTEARSAIEKLRLKCEDLEKQLASASSPSSSSSSSSSQGHRSHVATLSAGVDSAMSQDSVIQELRKEIADIKSRKDADHRSERHKLQAEIQRLRDQVIQLQTDSGPSSGTTPRAGQSKDSDDTADYINTINEDRVRLRNELEELHAHMDATVARLVEATRESLREQILDQMRIVSAELERQLGVLREEFKSVREDRADLRQDNERLTQENRNLQQSNEQLLTQNQLQQQQLQQQQQQAASNDQGGGEEAQLLVQQLERKLEQTKRLLETEKAAHNKAERNLVQQTEQTDKLTKQLADERRRRETSANDRAQILEAQVQQLQTSLYELEMTYKDESDKARVARLNDEQTIQKLQQAKSTLDLENHKSNVEIARLSDQLTKMEKDTGIRSKGDDERVRAVMAERDAFMADKMRFEVQWRDVQSRLDDQTKEISQLKARYEERLSELREKLSEATKESLGERTRWDSQMSDLKRELRQSENEMKRLKKAIQDKEQEATKMSGDLSSRSSTVATLEADVKRLSGELAQAQDRIEQMRIATERSEKRLKDLTEQNERLAAKERSEEEESDILTVRRENRQLQKELKQLQSKMEKDDSTKQHSYDVQIRELEAQIRNLEDENEVERKLNSEIELAKDELEERTKDLDLRLQQEMTARQASEKECERLEEEILTLEERLEEAQTARSARGPKTPIATVSTAALEQQLEEERHRREESVARLTKELTESRAELDDLRDKNRQAMTKLKKQHTEELTATSDELEAARTDILELKRQIRELRKAAKQQQTPI